MRDAGAVALFAVGAWLLGHCASRRKKRRYLQLVQEIPLALTGTSEIRCADGRVDHMSFDTRNKLLFVACLGEDKVIVVDVFAGRSVRTLSDGLRRPQGVLFVPVSQRLYVANAYGGQVVVFDCSSEEGSWNRIATIDFGDEADNLRYVDGNVWVGYGDGALGAIHDAKDAADIARNVAHDIACPEHPESFQIEASGSRVFINIADKAMIQVVDLAKGQTIASWSLPEGLGSNFPMCIDEKRRQLFVGVRQPLDQACVLVYNMESGAMLRRILCAGDADDIFLDVKRARVYVVGGVGHVSVLDATSLSLLEDVPTAIGARTGFMVDSRNSLYVACPATATTPSRLQVLMARD